MDVTVVTLDDLRSGWPVPGPESDKYARGVVGVDTGSARYPGAAVLSTLGALRSGAGFVRFCGAVEAQAAILARCPSVTFGPGRVQAWVVGCGWDGAQSNASRLAARRSILAVLYPVTEVPKEAAGRRRNTKSVDMAKKLFDEIAPKYADRAGGYTRIVRIGQRKGDAAEEAFIELV
jgi:ribosomal protein L17